MKSQYKPSEDGKILAIEESIRDWEEMGRLTEKVRSGELGTSQLIYDSVMKNAPVLAALKDMTALTEKQISKATLAIAADVAATSVLLEIAESVGNKSASASLHDLRKSIAIGSTEYPILDQNSAVKYVGLLSDNLDVYRQSIQSAAESYKKFGEQRNTEVLSFVGVGDLLLESTEPLVNHPLISISDQAAKLIQKYAHSTNDFFARSEAKFNYCIPGNSRTVQERQKSIVLSDFGKSFADVSTRSRLGIDGRRNKLGKFPVDHGSVLIIYALQKSVSLQELNSPSEIIRHVEQGGLNDGGEALRKTLRLFRWKMPPAENFNESELNQDEPWNQND